MTKREFTRRRKFKYVQIFSFFFIRLDLIRFNKIFNVNESEIEDENSLTIASEKESESTETAGEWLKFFKVLQFCFIYFLFYKNEVKSLVDN